MCTVGIITDQKHEWQMWCKTSVKYIWFRGDEEVTPLLMKRKLCFGPPELSPRGSVNPTTYSSDACLHSWFSGYPGGAVPVRHIVQDQTVCVQPKNFKNWMFCKIAFLLRMIQKGCKVGKDGITKGICWNWRSIVTLLVCWITSCVRTGLCFAVVNQSSLQSWLRSSSSISALPLLTLAAVLWNFCLCLLSLNIDFGLTWCNLQWLLNFLCLSFRFVFGNSWLHIENSKLMIYPHGQWVSLINRCQCG